MISYTINIIMDSKALLILSYLLNYSYSHTDTKGVIIKKRDEQIMSMLRNPKQSEAMSIIKLMDQYYQEIFRIKELVEKNDKKEVVEARKIFSDYSPSILAFTMDDDKMKKIGWMDEAFKTYYKIRIHLDAIWTELRRMLYD
uniref:Uncharacterized protein n=1 Tax=Clastoptera arizonana TaxID=38151 RepID=A0A1B6E802_9HEMI